MAGSVEKNEIGVYSSFMGFIFIFNLIVGAGALTIPHAFSQVGVVYGLIAISALAFTSYISATFVVEAIAGVNAILRRKNQLSHQPKQESEPFLSDHELGDIRNSPRSNLCYDMSHKVELAEMAQELFTRNGLRAFYVCVIVYLYGDLAIYAVAVPKSLREISCPRPVNSTVPWDCFAGLNSSELYRLYLLLFSIVFGPLAFGNMQKTTFIQVLTTIMRHASFCLMVLLSIIGIAKGKGREFDEVMIYERPTSLPIFFGVCIYSFMCHHSIPGLIAPIKDKSKLGLVMISSFVMVYFMYLLLCFSAAFRFHPNEIYDVYTLNFKSYPVRLFAYFLGLFPVFTLSANFPLISITLRENLRTLFSNITRPNRSAHSQSGVIAFIFRHSFALAAVVPPFILAAFTEDVSMLVGVTGAYAGLGIQWIVPACLIYSLRKRLEIERNTMSLSSVTSGASTTNPFVSPFSSKFWVYIIFVVAGLALVLITFTHLLTMQ